MRFKELPEDYAIVLQQIDEDGGDYIDELVDAISIDQDRVRHIVGSLHHKGLITTQNVAFGTWLGLSSKGHRLMRYLWPEANMRYRY